MGVGTRRAPQPCRGTRPLPGGGGGTAGDGKRIRCAASGSGDLRRRRRRHLMGRRSQTEVTQRLTARAQYRREPRGQLSGGSLRRGLGYVVVGARRWHRARSG